MLCMMNIKKGGQDSMTTKQLWEIDITLCRTFDGTKEEAIAEAEDDWDYFQDGYDKNDWTNKPVGEATITPINKKSKPTGYTHQIGRV